MIIRKSVTFSDDNKQAIQQLLVEIIEVGRNLDYPLDDLHRVIRVLQYCSLHLLFFDRVLCNDPPLFTAFHF